MSSFWKSLAQAPKELLARKKKQQKAKKKVFVPEEPDKFNDEDDGVRQSFDQEALARMAPPARNQQAVLNYMRIKDEADEESIALEEPAPVTDKGKGKALDVSDDPGSSRGSVSSEGSRAAPEPRGYDSISRLLSDDFNEDDELELLQTIILADREQAMLRSRNRERNFFSRSSSRGGPSSEAGSASNALSGNGEPSRNAARFATTVVSPTSSLSLLSSASSSSSSAPLVPDAEQNDADNEDDSDSDSDSSDEGWMDEEEEEYELPAGQVDRAYKFLHRFPLADFTDRLELHGFPVETEARLSGFSVAGRAYVQLICQFLSLPEATSPQHLQAKLGNLCGLLLNAATHTVSRNHLNAITVINMVDERSSLARIGNDQSEFFLNHANLYSNATQQDRDILLIRAFRTLKWTDNRLVKLAQALDPRQSPFKNPYVQDLIAELQQRRMAKKHCRVRRPYNGNGEVYARTQKVEGELRRQAVHGVEWSDVRLRELAGTSPMDWRKSAHRAAQISAIAAAARYFEKHPEENIPEKMGKKSEAYTRQVMHLHQQFLEKAPRRTKSLLATEVQPEDVVLAEGGNGGSIHWPCPFSMLEHTDAEHWAVPRNINFLSPANQPVLEAGLSKANSNDAGPSS